MVTTGMGREGAGHVWRREDGSNVIAQARSVESIDEGEELRADRGRAAFRLVEKRGKCTPILLFRHPLGGGGLCRARKVGCAGMRPSQPIHERRSAPTERRSR